MAEPAIKISAELTGLEKSAQRALANIERNTKIRLQVDDKASLPLGRISKNASELDSSLDAATSRVIAFGAAAAVFTGIAKTFDNLVDSIIEVEDALAKINVNFGATEAQLKSFGKEVFNAARNTAKTFEEAAKAAEELARQGLGTEETISRLNNALILSRRAGIDSVEAVDALTAAFNSFQASGLDTTQIINKLVAVDTRFAVSTKDLSEAISRAASTAQEAGVSFDEFLGIITAAQQTTARGGAVIGNALKTIFTRVQAAPETVKALEQLGVAITDSSGAFTSAGDRLKQYAEIRQTLSEGDRAYYDRLVSGTQQINILTAALNDLAKANGIAAQAQKIASGATDEAIQQNQLLNDTLKSVLSQTGNNFREIFSSIGEGAGENIKNLLKDFNSFLETIAKLDPLIKGLGNILSGPALVAGGVLLIKVFSNILINIQKSTSAILGLNNAENARLAIQKQINNTLVNATSEEIKQLNAAASITERRSIYLSIEQRVTAELAKQAALASSLSQSLTTPRLGGIAGGLIGDLSPKTRRVPSFADPLRSAIGRELASGVPASKIYIDRDSRVKGPGNPLGLLVANKIDEPLGGAQGVNRAIGQGLNPKTYGIPNFAAFDTLKMGGDFAPFNITTAQAKQFRSLFGKLNSAVSKVNESLVYELAGSIREYSKSINLTTKSQNQLEQVISKQVNRLTQGKNRQAFEATRVGGPLSEQFGGILTQRALNTQAAFQLGGRSLSPERAAEIRRAIFSQNLQTSRKSNIEDILAIGERGLAIEPNERRLLKSESFRQARFSDPILSQLSAAEIRESPEARARLKKVAESSLKRINSQLSKAFEDAARENSISKGIIAVDSAGRFRDIFKSESKLRSRLEGLAGPAGSSIAVQEKIRQRLENRQRRLQTVSLGAAFAAPFAAGLLPEGTGGTGKGIGFGAASGALQGVGIGALFGPVGAGIGAALGGLAGAFSKLKKSAEEVSKTFDEGIRISSSSINTAQTVLQNNEIINNLRQSGGDANLIKRLELKNTGLIASIESKEIKDALLKGSSEGISSALEQEGASQERKNTLKAISELGNITPENVSRLTSLLSLVAGPTGKGLDPAGAAQKFLNAKDAFSVTPNISGQPIIREKAERFQSRQNLLAVAQLSLGPDIVKNFGDNYELLAKALIDSSKAAEEAVASQQKLNKAVKNFVSFADVSLSGEPTLNRFSASTISSNGFGSTRNRQFEGDLSFLASVDRLKELGLKPGTNFQQEIERATARSQREKSLIAAESFLNPFARNRGISLKDDFGNINQSAVSGLLKSLGGSSDQRTALQAQLLLGGINEKQATYNTVFGNPNAYSVYSGQRGSVFGPGGGLLTPEKSAADKERARQYFEGTTPYSGPMASLPTTKYEDELKKRVSDIFDPALIAAQITKGFEGASPSIKKAVAIQINVISEQAGIAGDKATISVIEELQQRIKGLESELSAVKGKPRPPILDVKILQQVQRDFNSTIQ